MLDALYSIATYCLCLSVTLSLSNSLSLSLSSMKQMSYILYVIAIRFANLKVLTSRYLSKKGF